ncbi:MAG: hypothetical protein LBR53_02280 [Deltaproteobacteria bacterium]|jgi:hypothetical protein|nr:hypothetical protein [Deltaproteobacteria bacterium]
MKHAVKIALILAGVLILFWWGWSGNFLYQRGSLFRLSAGEGYYSLSLGKRPLGYMKRTIRTEGPEKGFSVLEDSALEIPVPGFKGGARVSSVSAYRADGRLESASFALLNVPGSVARARADHAAGTMECELVLGAFARKKSLPLPTAGPILVSAVVPWLSRQNELPLGKVLLAPVLDYRTMDFQTAELAVQDVTAEADELRIFEVIVKTPAGEFAERVDANGRLLLQELSGLEASYIQPEDAVRLDLAEKALSADYPIIEADEIPEPLTRLLEDYLPEG